MFIASLPDERRSDLERVDAVLSKVMRGHSRSLWGGKFWGGSEQSIIGYGDHTYQRSDKKTVEWFIVGLAPQKNYNSIYINAADDDGYVIERYADRLGKVKVRGAAITFKKADELDLEVLEEVATLARDRLS
ncbi:MAG TPA: DUF1801 domain-containing protein [Acidimicrobiia bacterium]|nr:DUF1801 domain-containing protein [Acidimicrobiia bacterium]